MFCCAHFTVFDFLWLFRLPVGCGNHSTGHIFVKPFGDFSIWVSAGPSAGQLHHFLVLLIGTDRENCEIVDQRIQARYRQQPVRGVALRHSLQTVETDMPFPNSGIWQPQ